MGTLPDTPNQPSGHSALADIPDYEITFKAEPNPAKLFSMARPLPTAPKHWCCLRRGTPTFTTFPAPM
jgi:hypothetical protein